MNPPDEVYLDHNATSPLRGDVLEAMLPWLRGVVGNPSSVHAAGVRARAALDEARARIAACLGAAPAEILFTSGGTESNNLALLGAARATAARRIVASSVEHPSVSNALDALREEGRDVATVAPRDDGVVGAEELLSACEAGADLVTVQWVNHETGAIHEVEAFAARRAEARIACLHVDGAQAVGRVRIDLRSTPIDLLTWTAHKLGGPVGIGALYRRGATPLQRIAYGGSQEHELRPGTAAVALAVGFAEAMERTLEERDERTGRHRRLRARLVEFVHERFPDARVVAEDSAQPSTTCIAFLDIDREALVIQLDLEGVRVSAGAACASGAIETSPVLRAMRLDERLASGAIRVSFGASTCDRDVERFLDVLERSVARARTD